MTFRERLKEEYPYSCQSGFVGGCCFCPRNYDYEPPHNGLCETECDRILTDDELKELCTKCWDRECAPKCMHCGGTLSEIRMHNGRRLRHCYSCHFEFYLDEIP